MLQLRIHLQVIICIIHIEALKLCEFDHESFNYVSELFKRSHGKRKALGLQDTMRLEL